MKTVAILLAGFCTLAMAAASTSAAENPGVPEKALQEMAYRVGNWESDLYVNGVKEAEGLPETTKWTPDKYAIIMQTTIHDNDARFPATGITGWNAERKQLVEHWYGADGSYATFRYSLDKKEDCWVGTAKWVFSDGRVGEGESVVEKKSANEWEWRATFKSNGRTNEYRSVNRRVKGRAGR
jgi:hypothetical protein